MGRKKKKETEYNVELVRLYTAIAVLTSLALFAIVLFLINIFMGWFR